MPITDVLSGIVINQNATATSFNWRDELDAQTVYQTFFLPSNYLMGTTSIEKRYPDLSGFQVMVGIDFGYSQTATLDCTLDYYILGEGWENLISGTVIGASADGQAWFDVIFSQSIPITADLAGSEFRLGITGRTTAYQQIGIPVQIDAAGDYVINNQRVVATLTDGIPYPVTVGGEQFFLFSTAGVVTYSAQQGVGQLYYTSPTPLVPRGYAYQSDGVTPLLGAGTTAALNFRVLSLSADSGTDFLGNEYRSCVIQSNSNGGNSSSSSLNQGTSSGAWISPPQPSQFAVCNQYFDVRPAPALPSLGTLNEIPNPNFQHDPLGGQPYGWTKYYSGTGVTPSNFQVQNGWSTNNGVQSLRSTTVFGSGVSVGHSGVSTTTGTQGFAVQTGAAFGVAATINLLSLPSFDDGGIVGQLSWYDSAGAVAGASVISTAGVNSLGVETLTFSATAPVSNTGLPTTYGSLAFVFTDTDNSEGTLDFFITDVMITPLSSSTETIPAYGDGDQVDWEWLGQAGASMSVQVLPVEPEDDTTVIDGIQVDPQTPNVAFNVYYSIDDAYNSTNMTEYDWNSKLWVRVPQAYIATQNQQYVFPAPVTAKYMKVEFSDLQAQSYNPGPFQQPVTYNKFPTWVADYFIALMETPSFVSSSASVTNDALTFAYEYYLDDLDETPAQPQAVPTDQIPNLTSYFSQSDAANLVDATTLAQINLVMQTFQLPTGSIVDTTTLAGQQAASLLNAANGSGDQPTTEVPTQQNIDYSVVSTTNREPVIFDQTMPVMYFFLTCRHTYKQLSAQFEYNKAYFVGVNSITFLRSNYQTEADQTLYIESGGDTYNSVLNDFDVESNGFWYTYSDD